MTMAASNQTTDRELLTRFANGEREGLGELARRYENRLLGLARGLLGGSSTLAEEAVQEVWVKVIRSAGSFEGRSEVWTWLYRITVNTSRDLMRRQRVRNRSAHAPSYDANEISEDNDASGDMHGDSGDAAGAGDSLGFDESIRAAVRALAIDKREALMLSVHAELTDEQAAEVLAIPLGTFKSRVRAAKTTLRRTLAVEIQS